jgi:hypothetical protein
LKVYVLAAKLIKEPAKMPPIRAIGGKTDSETGKNAANKGYWRQN